MVGTLLYYYAHAVNSTLLITIGTYTSAQNREQRPQPKPAKTTLLRTIFRRSSPPHALPLSPTSTVEHCLSKLSLYIEGVLIMETNILLTDIVRNNYAFRVEVMVDSISPLETYCT
jgi:hypothetical protein